jgi:hypothetical protein
MLPWLPRAVRKTSPVLLVLVVLGGAAFARSPESMLPGKGTLGDISVSLSNDGLIVAIAVDTMPAPPRVERLSGPDRLAFDFAGLRPSAGFKRQSLTGRMVKSIRTAVYGNDERGRPVTRVVLDLAKPVEFQTRSEPGRFVILLREGSASPGPTSPTASGRPAAGNRLVGLEYGASSVTLKFKDAVNPRKIVTHDPERLVLDFPGVVAGSIDTRKVKGALTSRVTRIRMSQFRKDPPLFRIVFEESSAGASNLEVSGSQVTVHFGAGTPVAEKRHEIVAPTHPGRVQSRASRIAQTITVNTPTLPAGSPSAPLSGMDRSLPPGGPKVEYANGLLTIDASNASLADVLYAIAEKTGAAIDMPFSDGMLDRVTFTMGPAKPREVLSTFLGGSSFNYYIVENGSGALEKVILTPK